MTAHLIRALAKVGLAALVLLFPATALAQEVAVATPAAPAATPAAPAGPLTAKLDGNSEVGHEGDPDGTATATIRVEPGLTRLCYEVAYRRLAPVDAAHIHHGAKGKNGPPVVALKLDRDENIEGCTAVSAEVAGALLAAPEDYYVDVKTTELKAGAIRGQLGK